MRSMRNLPCKKRMDAVISLNVLLRKGKKKGVQCYSVLSQVLQLAGWTFPCLIVRLLSCLLRQTGLSGICHCVPLEWIVGRCDG